jgi:hypothetical protein
VPTSALTVDLLCSNEAKCWIVSPISLTLLIVPDEELNARPTTESSTCFVDGPEEPQVGLVAGHRSRIVVWS